ncbi:DUF3043 domain-containing protein [Catellatospora citrea]|uniref:DUF3043 family protein n=1 Tax=Catellatospora citrea TaxID=53366 RepID=A0A8J3KDT7_9ACTN|nr:DUF3043 domain-containing protein [Catellatospora citrea]RKE07217.1 hypothetical protein C8E86_2042 [Catellatospora citrea]GIF95370.1 hypothetical protein Cci01nite_04640 [Catellatospora citrea]
MPLFSRKTTDVPAEAPASEPEGSEIVRASRSYTPAKGKATPKRTEAQRRKAEPPPANRREALKRAREKSRADRAESMAGMKAGDERYLLPRDKGPERRLVRDYVDSRRTVGTWFFGGAFLIFFLIQVRDPRIAVAANIVWLLLALAVIVDSFFICRKIKKLIKANYPKTTQRMGSLYLYAVMRGITFRRMRMPNPQVKIGDPVVPTKA